MIRDLLVSADRIAFPLKFRQIDRLAEPDANLLAAGPVAKDLFRKIVAEACNENRDDLRISIQDHFADSGLSGEEIVWIFAKVPLPFRMESDDVPITLRGKTGQFPQRKLVEFSFLAFALFAEERRVHRPPAHHEVHEPAKG